MPGRKWLVTRAAEPSPRWSWRRWSTAPSTGRWTKVDVPVELAYKGLLGRQRELTGRLVAVAALVVVGQVADSLVATARRHGVALVPGRSLAAVRPDRAARVGMLRDRTGAMAEYLARLRREAEDEPEEARPGTEGGRAR